MRFKLLRGLHAAGKGANLRTYTPGNVFEYPRDLTKLNTPGQERFERVPDSTPLTGEVAAAANAGFYSDDPQVATLETELENKPLPELLKMAQDDGVDLSSVNTRKKADVIAAIRAAYEG